MNETEFQLAKIKALLDAYVQLAQKQAEPGEKAYRLSQAIEFIRRQLRELLK